MAVDIISSSAHHHQLPSQPPLIKAFFARHPAMPDQSRGFQRDLTRQLAPSQPLRGSYDVAAVNSPLYTASSDRYYSTPGMLRDGYYSAYPPRGNDHGNLYSHGSNIALKRDLPSSREMSSSSPQMLPRLQTMQLQQQRDNTTFSKSSFPPLKESVQLESRRPSTPHAQREHVEARFISSAHHSSEEETRTDGGSFSYRGGLPEQQDRRPIYTDQLPTFLARPSASTHHPVVPPHQSAYPTHIIPTRGGAIIGYYQPMMTYGPYTPPDELDKYAVPKHQRVSSSEGSEYDYWASGAQNTPRVIGHQMLYSERESPRYGLGVAGMTNRPYENGTTRRVVRENEDLEYPLDSTRRSNEKHRSLGKRARELSRMSSQRSDGEHSTDGEADAIKEGNEDDKPWPSAIEYMELFKKAGEPGFPVYDLGVDPRKVPIQPEFIYTAPKACVYFLKCERLLGPGSFGFPRTTCSSDKSRESTNQHVDSPTNGVRSRKLYGWRKMSFVTDLPKSRPLVRYVTATCYRGGRGKQPGAAKDKVFRLHAVMKADLGPDEEPLVLVHIRAGGKKRVGVRNVVSHSDAEDPASPSLTSSSVSTTLAKEQEIKANKKLKLEGAGSPCEQNSKDSEGVCRKAVTILADNDVHSSSSSDERESSSS